jgi:hypothetical protein
MRAYSILPDNAKSGQQMFPTYIPHFPDQASWLPLGSWWALESHIVLLCARLSQWILGPLCIIGETALDFDNISCREYWRGTRVFQCSLASRSDSKLVWLEMNSGCFLKIRPVEKKQAHILLCLPDNPSGAAANGTWRRNRRELRQYI